MLHWPDYMTLFILGAAGSFLSGYLGVGGGIIYVPILDYFLSKLGYRDEELVKAILANSLFTIVFSGVIASYKQYRLKNFYPKEILLTAIPGMISVLAMTWLITQGTWYDKPAFNIVFACILGAIVLRMLLSKKTESSEEQVPSFGYAATGFTTGIVTALSGLGGGVLMTPIISEVLKQPLKKAGSISNGVIPLLAITVGIYNLSHTHIHKIHAFQLGAIVFPLVIPMIIASFIFAPLGVRASHYARQSVVKTIFTVLVSVILIKLLYEIIQSH
jgi:uncharacterized membrane protein YfcA